MCQLQPSHHLTMTPLRAATNFQLISFIVQISCKIVHDFDLLRARALHVPTSFTHPREHGRTQITRTFLS